MKLIVFLLNGIIIVLIKESYSIKKNTRIISFNDLNNVSVAVDLALFTEVALEKRDDDPLDFLFYSIQLLTFFLTLPLFLDFNVQFNFLKEELPVVFVSYRLKRYLKLV